MLEFISAFTNTFDRSFWDLLIYSVLNKNIFFETTILEMYSPVSKYGWKGFIDGTENANRPLLPAKLRDVKLVIHSLLLVALL